MSEIEEATGDVGRANKRIQKIIKDETKIRKHMMDLVDILSKDDANKKLADKLKNSYKSNVTNFMRDAVRITKDMK